MTQRAERMARLDGMRDKPVQDSIELGRIPTVNPPSEPVVGRTPEGRQQAALWRPDTRSYGDRLPHIHHNRLDLHILIHPLLTAFTA
jgi:hypothetical protein